LEASLGYIERPYLSKKEREGEEEREKREENEKTSYRLGENLCKTHI
jgi:hypothetical protein